MSCDDGASSIAVIGSKKLFRQKDEDMNTVTWLLEISFPIQFD